jgi:hypothetical protein
MNNEDESDNRPSEANARAMAAMQEYTRNQAAEWEREVNKELENRIFMLDKVFKPQADFYRIRLSGGWLTLEVPEVVNEQDVKVLRKLCDVIEESSRLCAEAACEGSGEKEDIDDE